MAYPKERKDAALKKLLPPDARPVSEVEKEEGISAATLFKWRNEARAAGKLAPSASSTGAASWTSSDKFAAVVETAAMNESEVSEYCRSRGVYPEELTAWRGACEKATD